MFVYATIGKGTGYYRFSRVFQHLRLCKVDGSYLKEPAQIQKQYIFILEDLGLEAFDGQSRLSLLEILEDRVGRKSSIIVSQIPVDKRHRVIGDPTLADAICDRIMHSGHRIELKGRCEGRQEEGWVRKHRWPTNNGLRVEKTPEIPMLSGPGCFLGPRRQKQAP